MKNDFETCEQMQTFKVILIGDAGVGKTALVRRFTRGHFTGQERATIGVDLNLKQVVVDGYKVKLKIWDSAGQERFRCIANSYYRNADAAILIYSIDDEDSFYNLHHWVQELNRCNQRDIVKVVVGNKCDLEAARAVSKESGVEFALCENAEAVMECSAKDSDNVQYLFTSISKKLIGRQLDAMSAQECVKDDVITYPTSKANVLALNGNSTAHNKSSKKFGGATWKKLVSKGCTII